MDSITIGYFLEDVAQERFLTALVSRVADEESFVARSVSHQVRNATGGRGQVLAELHHFLTDTGRQSNSPFDIMVVAIDTNCQPYRSHVSQIENEKTRSGYTGTLVIAAPNPHIEAWYMADPGGLQRATGVTDAPRVPKRKCKRARYKQALREMFGSASFYPPLGGAEFGDVIVAEMNLFDACRTDNSLNRFVGQLRNALRQKGDR